MAVVQGFTKTVSMPVERWSGYIKDYDGGTLMECVIVRQVNYLDVPGEPHRTRSRPSPITARTLTLTPSPSSLIPHPPFLSDRHDQGPARCCDGGHRGCVQIHHRARGPALHAGAPHCHRIGGGRGPRRHHRARVPGRCRHAAWCGGGGMAHGAHAASAGPRPHRAGRQAGRPDQTPDGARRLVALPDGRQSHPRPHLRRRHQATHR